MDRRVFVWLMETELIGGVCAVKSDKLGRNRLLQSLKSIRESLMIPDSIPLIPHSSVSGNGRIELWQRLSTLAGDVSTDSVE